MNRDDILHELAGDMAHRLYEKIEGTIRWLKSHPLHLTDKEIDSVVSRAVDFCVTHSETIEV